MATTSINFHVEPSHNIKAVDDLLDVSPHYGCATVRLSTGDAEIVIFIDGSLPHAQEAAKTIALAFNSLAKPATVKEAA